MTDKASVHENSGNALRVPDPTPLTTQALFREIAALKELFETRLAAMDKGILLLQAFADKQPTTSTVAQSVEALAGLHDEKFSSIATQFKERDIRTEQSAKDSKVAVDAALQAAKEAVGEQNKSNATAMSKSEAAFTKLIDQMSLSIQQLTKAIDDKIGDIKDRLTTIEGRTVVTGEVRKDGRDNMSLIIAAVAVAIAIGVAFLKN